MDMAIVVGAVATVIALVGLLGSTGDGRAWPSQVVVIALPIGIIAGGFVASVGATLGWVLVAVLSAFLSVLAGTLLGSPPALTNQHATPAAAGLALAMSALIALGLAVIVIMWAAHLIGAFSYLNAVVVKLALALAAAAYGLGGRGVKGMGRLVTVLALLGAMAIFGIGVFIGDLGSITSPQVTVPAVSALDAVAYAVGVVLIGAGFPVLRVATRNNRTSGVIAAVVVAVAAGLYLLGMLALYGGAFSLPSLVINVFPVYTPALLAAVIGGLITVVGVAVAGSCINAASESVARIQPGWYADTEHHRGPLRSVVAIMGLVVFIVAWLAPQPVAVVSVLAVLGAATLVAEWVAWRGRAAQPADPAGTSVGSAGAPAGSAEAPAVGAAAQASAPVGPDHGGEASSTQ